MNTTPNNTKKCSICFIPPLVDGGLSEWSAWGTCSKDCGTGTRTRTRNCTNPSPQYGGKDCTDLGDILQEEDCNTQHCPGKIYNNHNNKCFFLVLSS